MRLATAIEIYAGGPGSGCNPAAGTCGRHRMTKQQARAFGGGNYDELGRLSDQYKYNDMGMAAKRKKMLKVITPEAAQEWVRSGGKYSGKDKSTRSKHGMALMYMFYRKHPELAYQAGKLGRSLATKYDWGKEQIKDLSILKKLVPQDQSKVKAGNPSALIKMWVKSGASTVSEGNFVKGTIQSLAQNIGPNVGAKLKGFKNKSKDVSGLMPTAQKMYDDTQAYYKKKGINYLTVYRGTLTKEKLGKGKQYPAESWTTSRDAAEGFGSHILEARIPRQAVWFSDRTHGQYWPSHKDEQEVVVLSGGLYGKKKLTGAAILAEWNTE